MNRKEHQHQLEGATGVDLSHGLQPILYSGAVDLGSMSIWLTRNINRGSYVKVWCCVYFHFIHKPCYYLPGLLSWDY